VDNTVKILVIDDNEDDRLLCRRTLKKMSDRNYVILEASDGEEGLAYIKDEQPACVLLDYSLPGHNGIRILEEIHLNYPFLPLIMMTGQGNENVAVEAMQKGAQNYISKSHITQEMLDHVIQMAIEHCTLQKRIHEQRTSLEVFTHALAHDLKEPVRTIQSFTELIAESNAFTEKTGRYFQHIQNAANRMHMLIDTVFLYTRLDDPRKMARENCNTTAILHEVQENLDTLIRERGAVIRCDTLPEVYVNRVQLIQLLQNLISNAIHHSKKEVTIHIHAEEQPEHWLFSVSDNGPGIDSVHFQKIFEPFKRLTLHEKQGAGLGLAICKKIVESHDGKIWCESQLGAGTSFLFTLPKALSAIMENSPPLPKTVAVPKSSQSDVKPLANMLLVDDNKADIEITQFRVIERPGLRCNLLVARNGEEALTLLQGRIEENLPVDLMLLDINMPEMDGFELLERMLANEALRKVPVVMCTGSSYDKDMKKARALGAIGYLTKPIDFSQLKSVIDETGIVELCQTSDGYSLLRAA